MQMMTQHARADIRANAPSKDAALREALAWLRHWQDDAACGLPPTPESMRMVSAKISAALMTAEPVKDQPTSAPAMFKPRPGFDATTGRGA